MLELAILGLLKEQPLHGYELKKRLNDTLGQLWGVSFGSLYPALGRLERAGAIEVVDPASTATGATSAAGIGSVAATGSISGDRAAALAARLRQRTLPGRRTRKAYRITDRGTALFSELLAADEGPGTDEDRAFALRLAFCRYLPSEARLHLLQRRRAHLVERLSRARRVLSTRSARPDPDRHDDPYTRSLIEHGTETTERDLQWVDRLIALERQGGATQ